MTTNETIYVNSNLELLKLSSAMNCVARVKKAKNDILHLSVNKYGDTFWREIEIDFVKARFSDPSYLQDVLAASLVKVLKEMQKAQSLKTKLKPVVA